jgi:ubiquinone/menaquinone biosynthesis C-methylase UbiE
MAQNIYDDPVFFAGYQELRTKGTGLNDVLEQPALMRLLPESLVGLRVLDLGCGFGDFARKARSLGASSVLGIDISARMLEHARQRTNDAAIKYRQIGIEKLELSGEPFDLVVSSLALHYIEDYKAVVHHVYELLNTGGRFVFSVEHPICTALPQQKWIRDENSKPLHWPIDRYHDESARHTHWFVDDVIKYHRTLESYVNGLLEVGFRLTRLEEPRPLTEAVRANPALALHERRPPFLILSADKN